MQKAPSLETFKAKMNKVQSIKYWDTITWTQKLLTSNQTKGVINVSSS